MVFLIGCLILGPGVGQFFLFLGLEFPYNPLKSKKGALFIPRLLPGSRIALFRSVLREGGEVAELQLQVPANPKP